ncbi:unnamed protein product [Ceratitis capitata]|uniref:(Mediterranean fruit fly) hypothetical protein n=1 Tax=Ceratitis capitata TaxID=7213 RepID=A0A811V1C0_CERCA|nr:unnamed protein product [Ceratitis capitata]
MHVHIYHALKYLLVHLRQHFLTGSIRKYHCLMKDNISCKTCGVTNNSKVSSACLRWCWGWWWWWLLIINFLPAYFNHRKKGVQAMRKHIFVVAYYLSLLLSLLIFAMYIYKRKVDKSAATGERQAKSTAHSVCLHKLQPQI